MNEWVREMLPPGWSLILVLTQISSMCIIVHAKMCVVTHLLTQQVCERSWQTVFALFELQARLLSLWVPNSVLWAEHLVDGARAGLCLLPRLLSPAWGLSVLMPGNWRCSWEWELGRAYHDCIFTQGKLTPGGV